MKKKFTEFMGLSQYKVAFCYELAGKHFHLIMDEGEEVSLNFIDGECVQIAEKGQPYVFETYECLKGDDTTYLVRVMTDGATGPINRCWILDTEQSLVTMVRIEAGYDPEYPKMHRVIPHFGAIKLPGRALPKIRHHFSNRMVGHHIYWRYNNGFMLQHIYHTPTVVRADMGPNTSFVDEDNLYMDMIASDDPAVSAYGRERREHFEKWRPSYPFYEEPCFHIWIKENLNVFCFVEENANRVDYARTSGGAGILLLQEIDRLTDVGLSFNLNEYYMLSAVGMEAPEDQVDPLDTAPSPFDFSKLTAMPTVPKEVTEE